MDPNANLKRQQELLDAKGDRNELFELRLALRDWLAEGGADPDWSAYPDAAERFKRWSLR